MAIVFLALGSNLGNTRQHIEEAIRNIEWEIGEIIHQSSIVESAPWGFESKHRFANAVIAIQCALAPYALLDATQKIEQKMGRTVKTGAAYTDRIIDIDILLYDQLIINQPNLCIPHPHIAHRAFVYEPLLQIAPNIQLPGHTQQLKNIIEK